MKNRFLGLFLMFIAVFVWGISFVSTKIVLSELPPVSIAFFRQFVALIPLIILMIIRKETFRLKRVISSCLCWPPSSGSSSFRV